MSLKYIQLRESNEENSDQNVYKVIIFRKNAKV